MLTFYITRHGETEWNLERRLQGWHDSPLTERGINEAKNTRLKLKDIKIEKIYTSPSLRALNTAKFIGLGNIEIIEDKRLMEMNMGDWECKLWSNLGNEYEMYRQHPESFTIPGGENLKDVEERIKSFFNDITSLKADGNYVIVTHGATLKVIYMYFNNIPLELYWDVPLPVNNSLSKATFKDGKLNEFTLGEVYTDVQTG